jgi:hypothetical protein
MPDHPLEHTPEHQDRVRKRAYHLWDADGRPHGRDLEYWERAEFLIGIEDSAGAGQLPNPLSRPDAVPGTIVEEAEIQANLGEFPDRLTDQGERQQTPKARVRPRKAAAPPTGRSAS